MTTLQTRLAQADKPTKGPEMTTDNPDPLEVWHAACGKYEDACEAGDTLRDGVIFGDQAAAAIIAQHYAPVIAENERLRERWAMIDQLRGAEGCSVEIIHDNPDPGGSNCAIYVTDNFGEDYSTYHGDTIDDCLKQAIAERQHLGAKP